MPNRKLQVFVSSTYSDLIAERLAAIEAILAAGHIPAAMEQFTPGDETAWEKIQRWIDESDAFMLILAGRWGSIEPRSGKSYVQLEYEYAREQKKPFFSLVLADDARDAWLRTGGRAVVEEKNPIEHRAFEQKVREHHCGFWSDKRDIQTAVFRKLPEWAQRENLVGWVRGDRVTDPQALEELARLSRENRDFRGRLSEQDGFFEGLSYEILLDKLTPERDALDPVTLETYGLSRDLRITTSLQLLQSGGLADGRVWELPDTGTPELAALVNPLLSYGVLSVHQPTGATRSFRLNAVGRRFRNRVLVRSAL